MGGRRTQHRQRSASLGPNQELPRTLHHSRYFSYPAPLSAPLGVTGCEQVITEFTLNIGQYGREGEYLVE